MANWPPFTDPVCGYAEYVPSLPLIWEDLGYSYSWETGESGVLYEDTVDIPREWVNDGLDTCEFNTLNMRFCYSATS